MQNNQTFRLQGLVAATHTPFLPGGAIDWDTIPKQAEALKSQGVLGVFINGSTGEGVSLTIAERKQIAELWSKLAPDCQLKLVVHVGHTSYLEAADLMLSVPWHRFISNQRSLPVCLIGLSPLLPHAHHCRFIFMIFLQ
jgi:hypothetical protein